MGISVKKILLFVRDWGVISHKRLGNTDLGLYRSDATRKQQLTS